MDQVWPVAVTFVRHVVPPVCAVAFAGWLLLAHNPLLLDCAVFWADRVLVRTQWLAQWAVWILAVIPVALRAYPNPVLPTAVPPPPPEGPPQPRGRLCSNGDHSNAEETRIVVCEHFQKILGAVLIAAVLSWVSVPAYTPTSSPSHNVYTPPGETNRLPEPWVGASFINADVVVNVQDSMQADVYVDPHVDDNDDNLSSYLPPRHYRRPPSEVPHGADPRVRIRRNIPSHEQRDVVVRKSVPQRSSFGDLGSSDHGLPPIGASGFAAARKAARAAQNAAADQWVLAMRKRLMDENSEAKGLSVGSLHSEDDEFELARSAFGLGCPACGDGSVGLDVDSLYADAVERRQARGYTQPSDDWYKIDNPHDQADDAA